MKLVFKWCLCLAAMLLILLASILHLQHLERKYTRYFAPTDSAVPNPLMGYAPCAWYDTISEDVTLLYVDITWRELEPQEGVFDFTGIEEENQLERWRREGKHIVLRFVCDFPEDYPHRDIPDWVYDRTNGAGTEYHNDYGYGFSPDYSNAQFRQYHHRAVAALGKRYGQDDFISFVELGSLGHWGEWHTDTDAGIQPMPLEEIREEYVKAWVDAFPNANILLRRPFAAAAEHGLGLYNDMAGEPEDTAQWLDWIASGGVYDQTGEENGLVSMTDSWKSAPIGGELTSSVSMEVLLDQNLEETISLIRQSHTTFLGPKIAKKDFSEGYDKLLANMGYRLWISKASFKPNPITGASLHLRWENSGVAPFYAQWPVNLYVYDRNGQLLETIPVDVSLPEISPGDAVISRTVIPRIQRLKDLENYTLTLGIVDPMTTKNAVTFAMRDVSYLDGSAVLRDPGVPSLLACFKLTKNQNGDKINRR